jgi:hypothetical protein
MFYFLLMLLSDLIILSSRAKMLGLDPQDWQSITEIQDLPNMLFMMRNVLHLAASFSPLIVFAPKNFKLDSIRRDHLLAVSGIFIFQSVN